MDIQRLCANLKDKIAADLQGVTDPLARGDILIAALYELDRSVFPVLGPPRKAEEYLQNQAAVIDLITSIAIPLIRNAEYDRRGVAVLSEVGESSPDPLLQKKLSVYAQELLAKSEPAPAKASTWVRVFFTAGISFLFLLLLYYVWPLLRGGGDQGDLMVAAPAAAPLAAQATPVAPIQPAAVTTDAASPWEKPGDDPRPQEKGTPQEQVTKVRVVSNQVLVPVLLKNGAESARVELVLDTGASRTAIHEALVAKLRIDLRNAKVSQSELADGRIVTSRIARIDGLYAGPFGMATPELEVIPYKGADGIHDGLLGMDFLAKHRYQIDMEHEVIRWF